MPGRKKSSLKTGTLRLLKAARYRQTKTGGVKGGRKRTSAADFARVIRKGSGAKKARQLYKRSY